MKVARITDLKGAVSTLVERDSRLAAIHMAHGFPPLWHRPESFATLLMIILEQQVSLDSAKATYDRLVNVVGEVEPVAFLELSDETLRGCAFSRQKARYGRELALAIVEGRLDLAALAVLDDAAVHEQLTAIVGIGQWTSDIYRLMAMGRPDIWPLGDIALAQSLAEIHDLNHRPAADAQLELVEPWRPLRSVAARLLWLKYLRERNRPAVEFG